MLRLAMIRAYVLIGGMSSQDPNKPQRKRPRRRTKPKTRQKRTYKSEYGKLPANDQNEVLGVLERVWRGLVTFWAQF